VYVQSYNFYTDVFFADASEMLQFKPDGLKFYLYSNGKVFQFTMTTAWDISTASKEGATSFATTGSGAYVGADGDKMYLALHGTDVVREYTLSTPWDITTYGSPTDFSVVAQGGAIEGVSFKPDGTIMYTTENTNNRVCQWALATPWDISTTTHTQNFSLASQTTNIDGIFVRADGLKFYIADYSTPATIREYTMSTAWDISTATYTDIRTRSDGGYTYAVWFKPDGTKMYFIDDFTHTVDEYTLGWPGQTENSTSSSNATKNTATWTNQTEL
jgi:hypothetical protein